jgi:hypothetical protein
MPLVGTSRFGSFSKVLDPLFFPGLISTLPRVDGKAPGAGFHSAFFLSLRITLAER